MKRKSSTAVKQDPEDGEPPVKRTPCRHFSRNGYCALEDLCGFAHGEEELGTPDLSYLVNKEDIKTIVASAEENETKAKRLKNE